MSDVSELTLLVLRFGFLALLWVFIFAIVYALRSDLFGQRVRKLDDQAHAAGPGITSPFLDAANPQPAPLLAPTPTPVPGAMAGPRQSPPISSIPAPGAVSAPGSGHSDATGAIANANTPTRLVITSGPKSGTSILLGRDPLTIGRSSDSGLVIRDDFTSTHHARLMLWNDEWMLQDLDSTNGTFLGNQRVTVPTPVPLDTTIKIGTTTFELRR